MKRWAPRGQGTGARGRGFGLAGLGPATLPARSLRAGVTLIEVLIAITLLSLISVAMLLAMRIGLNTFDKTKDSLMTDAA